MEGVLLRTLRYKHTEEVAVAARLVEELRIRQRRVSYLEEMIEVELIIYELDGVRLFLPCLNGL